MMEEPALPRHHLTVRLHSAQLDTPAPLLERQEQQQLVCVAEIERFGRLRAEACASSSEEAILCEFEEVRQQLDTHCLAALLLDAQSCTDYLPTLLARQLPCRRRSSSLWSARRAGRST